MLNIFRNHLNSGQKGFWKKTLIKSFLTHTGKRFTFKYFKSKERTKGLMISSCIFEFQTYVCGLLGEPLSTIYHLVY